MMGLLLAGTSSRQGLRRECGVVRLSSECARVGSDAKKEAVP